MISGYVADLTAILKLLGDDQEGADVRAALAILTEEGHTLLVPISALGQAAIIAEPEAENLTWVTSFSACLVADLTSREVFRLLRQARFAARPHDVPLHQAHTAHLAAERGWPVLTADPAGWAGYDHLELIQV